MRKKRRTVVYKLSGVDWNKAEHRGSQWQWEGRHAAAIPKKPPFRCDRAASLTIPRSIRSGRPHFTSFGLWSVSGEPLNPQPLA